MSDPIIPRGALVCVIDDDDSVREALPDLLREFGLTSSAFASAEEFLGSGQLHRAECLVLDIAMPGMSGPELQLELKRRGLKIPIVFITAHGDETVFAQLMHHGATACLLKPFSESALFDAVRAALGAR